MSSRTVTATDCYPVTMASEGLSGQDLQPYRHRQEIRPSALKARRVNIGTAPDDVSGVAERDSCSHAFRSTTSGYGPKSSGNGGSVERSVPTLMVHSAMQDGVGQDVNRNGQLRQKRVQQLLLPADEAQGNAQQLEAAHKT